MGRHQGAKAVEVLDSDVTFIALSSEASPGIVLASGTLPPRPK